MNENFNSLKIYSVMHENAVNTNYRVKQIDFNGTYSYSEVTHLALTRSSDVNIYPNPTTDKLYIEGIDLSHADIQVLDVMAKEIQAYDIDLQANTLNMDRLSQGAYFIVIHSQDQTPQYKIYKH